MIALYSFGVVLPVDETWKETKATIHESLRKKGFEQGDLEHEAQDMTLAKHMSMQCHFVEPKKTKSDKSLD